MAWRGLHISRPSRLSLADGQIVVLQDDGDVRLPLEDIAWIVLDTAHATLTTSLLSACMGNGVALIVTDGTHLPSGLMVPFHRHFRQGGVALSQAAIGAPLKKRLWQSTIRAKIANQATALDFVGREGAGALRAMVPLVNSGDTGNVEARAAREYWGSLFANFRRGDEGDSRNMMLNYGYAVIRACVARALVASGLLPALGINHASAVNAFNLADDIVEPFRPFVDVLVWNMSSEATSGAAQLSVDNKRALAAVLLRNCVIGHEAMTLLAASEKAAESLSRAITSGNSEELELPAMVS
jgi:CRISP-associated protein Cas1